MSAPREGALLQRIESYQYPAGHVGHLAPGQLQQLQRFKALSQAEGYYRPASAPSELASHDDETLLRYLRARKFVPQDAFAQFKDTEDWRQENQLDKLYETIDVQEYEQTRRLYPQWTGRRDKRGIPVYVFEVAHLDSRAVNANQNSTGSKNQSITSKVPPKMLRLFALYENLCRFVLPLCSAIPDRPNSETPISQSNNIVDISKVGLKQFWNLKGHMQDASQLATAHYPETLDRIFIIGAPSFFPTVWGWIKRWFDPITVSKIFILSNQDMKCTLELYIDPENIPQKYGGKLDYKFGDLPILEPVIENGLRWNESERSRNGHRTLPTGPIKWQYDKDGDLVAIAVGSEKGQQRNRVIAGLRPDTKVPKLALSPGRNERPAMFRTTTGQATHPRTPPDRVTDRSPSATTDLDYLEEGTVAGAHVDDTSRRGTYSVPYHDTKEEIASPPPDSRKGTSSTRYEQQEPTHAAGQLAHATPDTQVNNEGDRTAVMEPGTVGQAPKEHPVPTPEEPQPSYIDQAKEFAGQAYEQAAQLPHTVLGAVGVGGKKEAEESRVEQTHEDPRVDGMGGEQVEEMLRAQTMSKLPA